MQRILETLRGIQTDMISVNEKKFAFNEDESEEARDTIQDIKDHLDDLLFTLERRGF